MTALSIIELILIVASITKLYLVSTPRSKDKSYIRALEREVEAARDVIDATPPRTGGRWLIQNYKNSHKTKRQVYRMRRWDTDRAKTEWLT